MISAHAHIHTHTHTRMRINWRKGEKRNREKFRRGLKERKNLAFKF